MAPGFAYETDLVIKGCYFEYHDGRLNFVLTNRVQIEDTIIARSVVSSALNGIEYGGIVPPMRDFTLLNNQFTKVGSGGLPVNNDGETLLAEYPSSFKALSIATGSSPTTLTDSTGSWTANSMVGHEVMIIRGPGAGQRRSITGNSSNTLTISQAWDIQPVNGQSYFNVSERLARHLVLGNSLVDQPRGIWYFRSPIDDVVIANNTFQNTGFPVFVRASQRMQPDVQSIGYEFNAMSGILVEGNDAVQDTNHFYALEPSLFVMDVALDVTQPYASEIYGNFYYDATIRRNRLENVNSSFGWGIYLQETAPPTPVTFPPTPDWVDNVNVSSQGIIVQGNDIENAQYGVTISTGLSQTIIWGNTFTNVANEVFDITLPSHSNASVGTIIDP